MSLLSPRRIQRWVGRWPVLLPLYDGRECPDCGAIVIGRHGKNLHREYHRHRDDWEAHANEAIRVLAEQAGIRFEITEPPAELPGGGGDPYKTIRVQPTDYDDQDEYEEDD